MSILITADTRFIVQGITGREAVTMTRELLDYGARVVGGVTPGRKGREVHGVPVEDTVRAFTERERVDASVVSVPPAFAADAVNEAIEAGIKLIVVVTERIPRKQVAQFVEYGQQEGVRIIGPNCLGVISPGKAKVGGVGGAVEVSADIAKVPHKNGDPLVEFPAEIADGLGALGDSLLLPAVRDGPEQGNQSRRRR